VSDKKPAADAAIDKLSFEEALARLTELVEKLESGQLPLEESVAAFEEGVKLSRRCESLLDGAEQRLQVLGNEQDPQ
jgi:exodeoxyribonuclease VII small subunit